MQGWILFAVLYALVLALFRWLGGIGATAEAFRSWGERRSAIREDASSS